MVGEKVGVIDKYTSGNSEEAITEIKAVPSPVALPVIDPNDVPGTKIFEVCSDGMIPFKTLERIVGFLLYIAQTHTLMVPYHKEIYLTFI